MLKNKKRQSGQLLIEVLIALAISAIILPVLANGLFASKQGKAQESQRIAATALLKEADEAVKSVREKGWSSFAINGTYHPAVSGNAWIFSPSTESINGYGRSIVISDVFRDANGVVVTSGGTLDPSTKKIHLTVTWGSPYASSVDSVMYLTRYLNNTSYLQTTFLDFTAGSVSGTVVVNNSGGEVVLGAGGRADWCNPNLSITALDLPKNGAANAISAIEGKVFAGTGDNASGVSYATVNISNTNPPVATILGTFDGFKTNGIFGESNYAYLATDNNFKEVEIINLTTNPYSEAGYFDAPGNGNGNSVFVSGDIGYMTDSNKLYTFDLSSKSGSRPQLGSVTLADDGKKVYVLDNYAYVATESTTSQLQIIQVSNNGRTLSVVGQADVGSQEGKDVFVNSSGTRAYLATGLSATEKELFILDISSKTGNRPILGSYEANGMSPKGITVVPGNKAIFVGTGGEEYQVINITNETSPVRCGGLNIDTGVNGVSSVLEQDGDAYSYIITGDVNTEFKIIAGGPGGQLAKSGTFTSAYFDPGSTVAYNRIIPNFTQPSQTTITFQVAVANAVSGSCSGATYYFVGPDGTSNTYFTSQGAIPLITNGKGYVNPGQCMKYKAYFSTTDSLYSPTLTDVSVNYSP